MAAIVAASGGKRGAATAAADPKATTVSGAGTPPDSPTLDGAPPDDREVPAGGVREEATGDAAMRLEIRVAARTLRRAVCTSLC